jgi:hypothetical protein
LGKAKRNGSIELIEKPDEAGIFPNYETLECSPKYHKLAQLEYLGALILKTSSPLVQAENILSPNRGTFCMGVSPQTRIKYIRQ